MSPGVDLKNVLTLKMGEAAEIEGEATPGVGFIDRGAQIYLHALLRIKGGPIRITVGYRAGHDPGPHDRAAHPRWRLLEHRARCSTDVGKVVEAHVDPDRHHLCNVENAD